MSPLVSTTWLEEHLQDENLVILDASAENNHNEVPQILGAIFMDLKNKFVRKDSEFPNTIPDKDQFQQECRSLGINNKSTIILYDRKGVYLSSRAWWLFRSMGHQEVYVLDGGLPEWNKNNLPVQDHPKSFLSDGNFTVDFHPEMVKSYEDIKSNISSKEYVVVDARSEGRFNGTSPEPREGLQSGCIPDSINIPYNDLIKEGKVKSRAELLPHFNGIINEKRPLVFSCGSGITACIVLLASEIVLENKKAVYDGSWTEWAIKNELYT